MRNPLLTGLLLSTSVTPRLAAQCPDGRPPPCGAPAAVAVDTNRLVILPFEVRGPQAESAWLREGLVDLLSTSLDGFAGWQVVSPRTVLVRTRQAQDLRDLTQATGVARALGAGRVVVGSAVVVGQQIRVHADLYDATRVTRLTTVNARGTKADPGPLADSLAVGLARYRLARQPAGHQSLVREYATASPGALRSYLAAEQLVRRGALQPAADSLQAAIAADSGFGLAYYRLLVVSAFGTIVNLAAPNVELLLGPALRHVDRLPPRHRDILMGAAALWQGRRADALRHADALGQRYQDDADAAYVQGEIYFHYGITAGESPRAALESFERSIRLDPDLLDSYGHAIEARCLFGDSVQAWDLLHRALRAAPRSLVFRSLEAAMQAALRGAEPASLEPGLRELDGLSGLALVRASIEVRRILDHDPARAVELADGFLRLAALPEQPRSVRGQALRLRTLFRTAQGRHEEASELSRQALKLDPTSVAAKGFAALFPLLAGRPAHDTGNGPLADLRGAAPAAATQVIVAWVALEQGDTTAYAVAVNALDQATAGQPTRPYAEGRLAGLRGLLALKRGDSTLARRELERAYDASSFLASFLESAPDAYFTIHLARLELAAHDVGSAARRLFVTFLDSTGGLIYRAEAEELRGQIARQQGDTASAVRAYRNFIALWNRADPELQPRVQAAREALARLER